MHFDAGPNPCKFVKFGAGPLGAENAPRCTKTITSAKGFFQSSNLRKYLLKYISISVCNKVCNNVCNNVCSNVCNIASVTYVMTYVHPNCKSISSAKPHPQPPYQALAWSYRLEIRRKALRVIPRGKHRLTVYRAHQVS